MVIVEIILHLFIHQIKQNLAKLYRVQLMK